MYNTILARIKDGLGLSEKQLEIIQPFLIGATYKKGAILLHEGDFADKTYYIGSGMLREYFISQEGDEITIQLAAEEQFLYSWTSYFRQQDSKCFIEAIEKTKLVYIHKHNIEYLFDSVPELYKWVTKVHQRTLMDSFNRHIITGQKSTEERVACFERLFPHFVNRISQKYIASFINVAPQTLSRVRNIKN